MTRATDQSFNVTIDGMTCAACEVKIERALRTLPGVMEATVSAADGTAAVTCAADAVPDRDAIAAAIARDGYVLTGVGARASSRPSLPELAALFGAVFAIGWLLSASGALRLTQTAGAAATAGAALAVGLFAASSSCIAVSGGVMLSSIARSSARGGTRVLHALSFVAGRVAGYALLGGIIGMIGRALTPSPAVTGAIALAAALYMLAVGLEMLGLAPRWLRRAMPRMPKRLGHRVLAADGTGSSLMPFLLGALTFFLPCGFTQSFQIYALTTGSFLGGASLLGAFALGTAPALLALGFASGSLKGRAGQLFFRLSGALVAVLGLWNIQNGLTTMGYPLSLPSFGVARAAATDGDPNTFFADGRQTVQIDVSLDGYDPDHFTLRAGTPTELLVGGNSISGCASVFVIPRLGVQQALRSGTVEKIAFTPIEKGTYSFSCSMGMIRGSFDVI